MHHIIATFGVECDCKGKDLFDAIKLGFMDLLVNEESTAEKAVMEFDLRAICSPLDAIEAGIKLNTYFQAEFVCRGRPVLRLEARLQPVAEARLRRV